MCRRQAPRFVKESGRRDAAGGSRGDGLADVNDGVVGQLGHLAGIVEIVILAEGEAAVEDDVFLWVQRIGVDQYGSVADGGEGCLAERDGLGAPANRKCVSDLFEELIGRRVAPKDEVMGGD